MHVQTPREWRDSTKVLIGELERAIDGQGIAAVQHALAFVLWRFTARQMEAEPTRLVLSNRGRLISAEIAVVEPAEGNR